MNKLPKYGRASFPVPMHLTSRDQLILEAIHAYDGMLGFSQLRRMFFTGESQAKRRLMLLYQNKYLNRPNKEQRRRIPEMIYWLDKQGAQIVASLNGDLFNEFSCPLSSFLCFLWDLWIILSWVFARTPQFCVLQDLGSC